MNSKKSDIIMLSNERLDELEYEPQTVAETNCNMKECGKSMLGSPTLLK